MGDHAENLAENVKYMREHNLEFSQEAKEELQRISDSTLKAFTMAIQARNTKSLEDIRKVSQYEDEVDSLEDELRENHIARLSSGKCTSEAGIVFLDIISNLERISDHALNIVGYIRKEL